MTTDCTHCGLPVPPALLRSDGEEQFCCSGCATVYALLNSQGLGEFYRYREQVGQTVPARVSDRGYTEFDTAEFEQRHVASHGDVRRVELQLEGVHCVACVWLIERLPRLVPGVIESRLDFGRGVVEATWDPQRTQLSVIARQLHTLGYPPHPVGDSASQRDAQRRELKRIAVAGACAGNAMLMAFALYSGHFANMSSSFVQLFRWGSLLVTLPSVLWAARPFWRGAWSSFQARTPHMDLPIVLGISAGFGWGVWSTVTASGDIYFDSVTTLIFLLLVGRYLQSRGQRAAAQAAELLLSLTPRRARRIDASGVSDVPVEALSPGMRVEVRSGDTLPADGVVRAGESWVDVSFLTGEPTPVRFRPGDSVHAGALNVDGRLEVEVEKTGEETRLGEILREVERARGRRAPIVRTANRVSAYFVTAILVAAMAVLASWLWVEPSRALDHTVALLVICCPCALGLATPLAIDAAVGRAARRGSLVKGGDCVETLARPALWVFDKTGTLTRGALELVAWEGEADVRALVAAAEAQTSHPVARALCAALPRSESVEQLDVKQHVGGGLEVLGESPMLIGSPSFVGMRLGGLPEDVQSAVDRHARRGRTVVLVSRAERVVAVAALADRLRDDTEAALRDLRSLGHRVAVLSGDDQRAVDAVVAALDVDFEFAVGGATPERKLELIEARAAAGPVVMIGDGVNDTAALAAASVGIGVHGGAEACLASADVFTTRPGLAPLVTLAETSAGALVVIRQNLAFSLLYNLVGASLAAAGLITPLVAAVVMPISSLLVVANSYRGRGTPVASPSSGSTPAPLGELVEAA